MARKPNDEKMKPTIHGQQIEAKIQEGFVPRTGPILIGPTIEIKVNSTTDAYVERGFVPPKTPSKPLNEGFVPSKPPTIPDGGYVPSKPPTLPQPPAPKPDKQKDK